MTKDLKTYKNYLKYATIASLCTGALVRIVVFFQNRSLFIDEANLARNFVEKNLAEFFQNLDYEQYSPPLFSVLEKFNLWIFGANEYALRLLPLLSSLVVLFLFYRLGEYFIKNKFLLFLVVFMLSFSNIFLEYSTSVKQYMSDTMTALALVLWAIREHKTIFSWQHVIKWTSIGTVAVWWSMTSVFVLAAVGIYFLLLFLKKRDWVSIFRVLASIVGWLISFGFYYFSILKTDVGSDYLNTFHQAFFLPILPTSMTDWTQIGTIFCSILRTTVGYTTLAYGFGAIGVLASIVFSIKNKKKETLLLFIPIGICLGASMLQLYSLMPRLTLFFIPFLLILIALGWQFIFEIASKWIKIILIILLLAVASLQDSYQFFIKKYEIEEIQPIMQYIQANQEVDDTVFVYLEAVPAFQFYKNNHENKAQYTFQNIILGDYESYPTKALFTQNGQLSKRVWFIYSHVISDVTRQRMAKDIERLKKIATEIDRIEAAGAYGFLFELK